MRGRRSRWAAVVFGAILAVLLLVGILGPIASWATPPDAARAAAINATRQILLATAAGIFAVVGLAFTGRTYFLSRRGQLTDRFSKATTQLASGQITERLGGIYALEHLMRESPHDHDTIVEMLAAFVRESSPVVLPSPRNGVDDRVKVAVDAGAAAAVLGRRPRRAESYAIDLSYVFLRGANLSNASLANVDLKGSDLSDARLDQALLTGADLRLASLTRADLYRANLRGADLRKANFVEARLDWANLQVVDGRGAQLQNARLPGASLIRAELSLSDFEGASLARTDLAQARLWRARLRNADLTAADLDRTDFLGADMDSADVTFTALSPESSAGQPYHVTEAQRATVRMSGPPVLEYSPFLDKEMTRSESAGKGGSPAPGSGGS
jgi:uncharacterized protein YjbI with pentapeptide repeats